MAAEHHERHVSRRQFAQGTGLVGLGLLAGCGQWPGQTQRPDPPRIGYVSLIPMELSPRLDAFRQGLADVGYVEGHNLLIEWRSANESRDRLPGLLSELLRLDVRVIVAAGEPVALAAKQATDKTPIVTVVPDPIAAGLATSLAHPGGNVTGLADIAPQLSGKRLELLRAIVPTTARVGVLWNSSVSAIGAAWSETQEAMQILGLDSISLEVHRSDEFEAAFVKAKTLGADGLLVLMDTLVLGQRAQIVELAARYRLPVMYPTPDFTSAGGLMTYGTSHDDLFRRLAVYVDKILKGASPADLPVELPMRFDFVINLKTAQALGLTIPPHVLLQATEVIQ